MKTIVSVFIILLVFGMSVACNAETYDFSEMSAPELRVFIEQAEAALYNVNHTDGTTITDGDVLYENAKVGIKIVFRSLSLNGDSLKIRVDLYNTNPTDKYFVIFKDATINGWDIKYYGNEGFGTVSADSNARAEIRFAKAGELAEVHSIDEIQTIRFKVEICIDSLAGKTAATSNVITLKFE